MSRNKITEKLLSSEPLNTRQIGILCLSILVVALCGIAYELIIASVSCYLLGNSVYQFSITIGLFMFAMGMGSYLSRFLTRNLIHTFVFVEVLIALTGGLSSFLLFLVFSYIPSLYQIFMYAMLLAVGTMVGVEIPLLTRIITTKRKFKDALAEVFSLDYLGALLGSLLFPLVLLPHLGLVRSSFAIGLLNGIVAIINVLIFRNHLRRPFLVIACSVSVLLTLVGALLVGSYLSRFVEQQLYFDNVVYQHQSPYQRVILTKSSQNEEHRLYIDGHIQFAERDEHRYHEALVHPVMSLRSPARRILILGGGDGMAAREVFKWKEVKYVDLVDIDPDITQICRKVEAIARLNRHSLDDPRLHLHHDDAFTFVRRINKPYDRIIIDLPDPHNEVLNKLYSREFYRMLKSALKQGGGLVSQSSSPFTTRRVYWCIANTMESAGWETKSYQSSTPSFGLWGFHLATHPETSSTSDHRDFPVNLNYLTREVFAASQVFGRDTARLRVPVNTMLEPHLYQLYHHEIQNPISLGSRE